jgi:RNA polymerase sigma factor (sigma-70 family)
MKRRPNFIKAWEAYKPMAYGVVRMYIKNENDYDDAYQCACLNAWKAWNSPKGKFRGGCAINSWFYMVVATSCLMMLRKQKQYKDIPFENINNLADSVNPYKNTPEDLVSNREILHSIHRRIGRMGYHNNIVFMSDYVDRRPNTDIAEALNISIPAAKSVKHRAKVVIDRVIEPYKEALCG